MKPTQLQTEKEKPFKFKAKCVWQLNFLLQLGLLCIFLVSPATAQLEGNLADLSPDSLMNIVVSLPSKKAEKYFNTSAAVTVITSDDIQRFGFTSIMEIFRMVPGMEVARIDANKWAISCRGFNNRFANKLLVLIDGQSIYTSMFSGVFWEIQDLLLEDIERIEVIRGPGATVWGANAVNGVINIITKKSPKTQGNVLYAQIGTEERDQYYFQHGGKITKNLSYRFYTKYFERDGFIDSLDQKTSDHWWMQREGIRLDWEASPQSVFSLQGNHFSGKVYQTYRVVDKFVPPYVSIFDYKTGNSGYNLNSKWDYFFTPSTGMNFSIFYDWYNRKDAVIEGIMGTLDFDFTLNFPLGAWQEITWGWGYRYMWDDVKGSVTLFMIPAKDNRSLYSTFIQDEISMFYNRLRVIFGSKFEHNPHTGFEYQPNIRFSWLPHARHSFWMAVSKAVRTPSRGENNIFGLLKAEEIKTMDGMYALVTLGGKGDLISETQIAHEIGYRIYPAESIILDVTGYYNKYHHLRSLEPEMTKYITTTNPSYYEQPFVFANKMKGTTYGYEMSVDYRLASWWQLKANYSYIYLDLIFDKDSEDPFSEIINKISPKNQAAIWNKFELPHKTQLSIATRYVDELKDFGVDAYFCLDFNLNFKLSPGITVSIVGQNLFDKSHTEFTTPSGFNFPTLSYTLFTKVERGVYGAIRWAF